MIEFSNETGILIYSDFRTRFCLSRTFKIQRPSSGGDLPQVWSVNSSTLPLGMDDELEKGDLRPYVDRPRTFPNVRNKAYNPLVRTLILFIFL